MADRPLKRAVALTRSARSSLRKLAGDSNLPLDLLFASVAVGAAAGYTGVFFHQLADVIQHIALGSELDPSIALPQTPWWLKLSLPSLGLVMIAPIVYRWVTEARGTGTPEVMKSVRADRGHIRGRVAVAKLIASSITVGTGGSVGREGPIIQIGAAIGSKVAQVLRWSHDHTQSLVAAGAAAGIAAMFNAPIAGAFFALEVIQRNFAASLFAPIVLSSVTATAVSRAYLGDFPAFGVPHYELVSGFEVAAYVVMGLACALVGQLFIHFLDRMLSLFDVLRLHDFMKPLIGGIGVGGLIILSPEVYGTGFGSITHILTDQQSILALCLLLVTKILATSLTIAGGGSGGIFSPSLFLGAIIGWLFGFAAHHLAPASTGIPGAYALVGMGAMLAAVTHAPITSILVLFEITGNYEIILPLMAATVTATSISRRISPHSFYDRKLRRLGVDPDMQSEAQVMANFRVEDVMRTTARVVDPSVPFPELVAEFLASRVNERYVVDSSGVYHGMISLQDINELSNLGAHDSLIVALDIARTDLPKVVPGLRLTDCIEKMLERHCPVLPVVEDNKFLGTVSEHDMIGLYNREVIRKDILGTLDYGHKNTPDKHNLIHLPHGLVVERVPIASHHANRTLKELDLRAAFNLTVVSIHDPESPNRDEVPNAERRLPLNGHLVVVGEKASIAAFVDAQHG